MKNQENELSYSGKILIFSTGMYFFLLLLMPQYNFLLSVTMLAIEILFLLDNRSLKLQLNVNVLVFFLFIAISFFGIGVSGIYIGIAYIHIVSLSTILLNYILLISIDNWQIMLLKILSSISGFFLLGSIVQLISPNILININRIILGNAQFVLSFNQITWADSLVSFSFNPAINGYMITITLLIATYYFLLEKNNRKLTSLFIIVLFYFLVLTGKRGFLLFSILIFLYLFLVSSKYKLSGVIYSLIFIFIIYLIITNTEMGIRILERTFESDDVTSGRSSIYMTMIQDIKKHPIFGSGTYTTQTIASVVHGHNVYLQILRENGLVGFIMFLTLIIYNFVKTHFNLVNSISNTDQFIHGISQIFQLIFILWSFTGNPLYDIYPLLIYFIGVALSENQKRKGYRQLSYGM